MLDLEDRLDELSQLGLHQRMRMVSGPQGPRVVLDGRPVHNYQVVDTNRGTEVTVSTSAGHHTLTITV